MENGRDALGYRQDLMRFTAGDGRPCNLIHVTTEKPPHKGPVLLVHGAGVRANIFRAPVRETVVDYLLAEGWDVWLENWRASIDLPPAHWVLDEAAIFDHPVAIEEVARRTGSQTVKALVHCQGSTSFTMALAAGLLPRVDVVVSNAVSLHPVVPAWSHFKLAYTVPLLQRVTDHLDPEWGNGGASLIGTSIRALVDATHHECNNSVCRLVSFTYGSGFPALWSHDLINEETHQWLCNEFGFVPLTFFRQMGNSVRRGQLTPTGRFAQVPPDFLTTLRTRARFALFAGARNLCFLAESQERTFRYLRMNSERRDHTLHVLPEYGHLDVFMGRYAATDIFPLIASELDRN